MKKLQAIFLVLLVLALALIVPAAATCQTPTPQGEAAAKAVNAFAIDLYREFRKAQGNIFFSPYSVSCLSRWPIPALAATLNHRWPKPCISASGKQRQTRHFALLMSRSWLRGEEKVRN